MAEPSRKPLNIAFGNMCMSEWIAGCYYLQNLFIALRSVSVSPDLEITLVKELGVNQDLAVPTISDLVDHSLTFVSNMSKSNKNDITARIMRRLKLQRSPHTSLLSYLEQERIDALFTLFRLSLNKHIRGGKIPVLTWIPDFQSLHHPDMFTADEIRQQNKALPGMAESSTRIILSSHAAMDDLSKVLPDALHKARVIHFVAQISTTLYGEDPAWVYRHYHLPERYIYLPNQFWKHKNHQLVIEAIAQAKEICPEVTIVCTGHTHDYRNPEYFRTILTKVSEANLRSNFIILGMVPHNHIFALMRQSLAVLQPSLFEGWSTTVEEVKSLGKTILLSDIVVHREQNPPESIFFNPTQPEELSQILVELFSNKNPGPDYQLEANARLQLPIRTHLFGEEFLSIVRDAVEFASTRSR